jgi:hypothetical protein
MVAANYGGRGTGRNATTISILNILGDRVQLLAVAGSESPSLATDCGWLLLLDSLLVGRRENSGRFMMEKDRYDEERTALGMSYLASSQCMYLRIQARDAALRDECIGNYHLLH